MQQHFVPQFYLRAFRDPSVPEGQEPWVWVADLEENAVVRRAPRNVGKKANYYAFPDISDDANDRDVVEQILSQVESAAAPVTQKLLRADFNLGEQEWADLLFFMAFFVTRVPFFRNLFENSMGEVMRMRLRMAAQDRDYFEQMAKKAYEGKRELTPEEIEKARQWVLKGSGYTVREAPEVSLGIGMQLAMETIYPLFSEMRWCFLQADSGDHFITCDSPVSWFDPTPRPPISGGHGLAMRNVEVTFPIGPELCLLGKWEGPTGLLGVRPDVEVANRRRVAFAERYIFADSGDRARWAVGTRRQMEQEAR